MTKPSHSRAKRDCVLIRRHGGMLALIRAIEYSDSRYVRSIACQALRHICMQDGMTLDLLRAGAARLEQPVPMQARVASAKHSTALGWFGLYLLSILRFRGQLVRYLPIKHSAALGSTRAATVKHFAASGQARARATISNNLQPWCEVEEPFQISSILSLHGVLE